MTNTHTQDLEISTEQIKAFLRKYPHFFEENAYLLADISLPSPHGNGVISLAERQQLAQRDKISTLENLIADMIENAEQNSATSEKIHQLSIGLLNQNNFRIMQLVLNEALQLNFGVTQSLIRFWVKPSNNALASDAAFTPMSEPFNAWINTLTAPYCGEKPATIDASLFADSIQSFACIPLGKKGEPHVGVLILGATDPQRFQANIGTIYLEKIGELVSTALYHHLFTLQL